MPHRVVFSPEGDAQLLEIYRYVERKASPAAAERFTAAIVDHCEAFETFPERGTRRDDLRSGLRTVGFRRSVTIAFTVDEDMVTVLGVFYGGQDSKRRSSPRIEPVAVWPTRARQRLVEHPLELSIAPLPLE